MIRGARWLVIAVALAATPSISRGHSPPSETTVDRYLKLTPMGDRVRLAYTVVFGERPGARVRQRLDRDRDGRLSASEADALGRELDRDVAAALRLGLDGRPLPWTWARVDVGLGTDRVAAGALSVDLIAWLCTSGGDAHELTLRDDLRLPDLGTTEVTIETGPGVTIERRLLGADPMPELVASWTGAGPLPAGLTLGYRTTADASRPRDGRCAAEPAPRKRRWPLVALGGGAAGAMIAIAVRRRRRRRR